MDDQHAPGVDFSDWFLKWLDLIGECEQARGRMIDDDIKAAVMLKRSPKELRDHLVLESPQLANVEEPFRGHCGHCWKWCDQKAQCHQWEGRCPMELGAMVSNPSLAVVSDPGSSVSQRVQAVNSSPVPLV